MSKFLRFSLTALTLLSLVQCTIQKRLHNRGYHIEWNNKIKSRNNSVQQENTLSQKSEDTKVNIPSDEVASIDNSVPIQTSSLVRWGTTKTPQLSAKIVDDTTKKCDEILLLNGNSKKINLVEIGEDFIKYHECGDVNKVLYSYNKSSVKQINFANGDYKVINKSQTAANSSSKTVTTKDDEYSGPKSIPSTLTFGIVTFVLSLPIWVFLSALGGVLLMALSFGLNISSLGIIKRNSARYKGTGGAILLTVLSVLLLVIMFMLTLLLFLL